MFITLQCCLVCCYSHICVFACWRWRGPKTRCFLCGTCSSINTSGELPTDILLHADNGKRKDMVCVYGFVFHGYKHVFFQMVLYFTTTNTFFPKGLYYLLIAKDAFASKLCMLMFTSIVSIILTTQVQIWNFYSVFFEYASIILLNDGL